MRSLTFLSIVLLLLTVSSAQAQWASQEIEDPFGDDHITGAFTARSGKGLVVRCVGTSRLELMFMPNESGDESVALMANTMGLKILIRIDKDKVDSLEAATHSSDGKIVTVADIEPALADRMAAAKKRIAAVAEMAGQKIGSVSFGVKGSRRHISKVLKACDSAREPS